MAEPRVGLRALVLAAVLALAAQLHVGAALHTRVDQPIRGDAADYVSYAVNLVHNGVYSRDQRWLIGNPAPPPPDAVRSPGYPLLLAAAFGGAPIGEAALLRATLLQALIAVATVALAYLLARRFVAFPLAAACAALVAMTPQLVTSTTYLLSETWFTAWITGALLLLAIAAARSEHRVAWLAAAGLALGVAALIRPTVQYLPVALALAMWRLAGGRAAAVLVASFALAFAPWIVRNEMTLGVAGDSSLVVGTLLQGAYPGFEYEGRPETLGFAEYADPNAPEYGRSVGTVLAHIASEFRREPARMLAWYALGKPVYLFRWDTIQGASEDFVFPVLASPYLDRPLFRATRAIMLALHWPLMIGGFAGALLVWRRAIAERFDPGRVAALRLLSVVYAYVIAVHVVCAPLPRYSVPFRPLTYLFALLLVPILWNRMRADER